MADRRIILAGYRLAGLLTRVIQKLNEKETHLPWPKQFTEGYRIFFLVHNFLN
ncbi:MAG TPA: hypothetical protein VI585_20115 [Candidatus Binatia bacterium]